MNLDSLLENIANELDLHNSKKKTFCWMIKSMISQQNVQHHSLIQDFKNEGTEKSKRCYFSGNGFRIEGMSAVNQTERWGHTVIFTDREKDILADFVRQRAIGNIKYVLKI